MYSAGLVKTRTTLPGKHEGNLRLDWRCSIVFTSDEKALLFLISNVFFSAQAQMLLSEIQNSIKLALPYLAKRCIKC